MSPIITLTTDFGYDDAYVAAVKGAILSINPEANIIDDLAPIESRPLTEHTHDLKEIVFKKGLEIVAITDPRFWRHPVSSTFHGRDIFAPVAAGLALGISLYEFGEKITSLHVFSTPKPSLDPQGNLVGHILYVDP